MGAIIGAILIIAGALTVGISIPADASVVGLPLGVVADAAGFSMLLLGTEQISKGSSKGILGGMGK